MSITIDHKAITQADKRVISANGRHAAAHRVKRGVGDPVVVDGYGKELTTVIARCIIRSLAKRPHLDITQRLELIDLLMPSDSDAVDEILGLLRRSKNGRAHEST